MLSKKKELFKIKEKKVFFFDLDGTLYLGNKLFEGVFELIELLIRHHKKFYFLSNNSSKSTKDYLKKLTNFKLNITTENIILSQHPTIAYLKKEGYKRVFLMGTSSLKNEFKGEGFELTEDNPEIIVLAFDKELTYERLTKATRFLLSGIPYIATHPDDRCPIEDGYIPDAGGIAALLQKAAERMPRVFGKPNKEMVLFKLEQLGMKPEHAVLFGDRLYTDIQMGKNANITTCCVLSGETTLESLKNSNLKPEFIINGVWELIEIFK